MTMVIRFLQCERERFRDGAYWLVPVLLLLFMAAARAETISSNPHKDVRERIGAALSQNAGAQIAVTSVEPTEAAGLLEVTLENGLVLYATENGDHFVVGDLYAIHKTGLVNIAEQKRETDRRARIAGVDLSQMIIFSPDGEVRDYITVFTDVTCFYCQKLHREVEQLNASGVEVRYLAYPRAGPDSDGARKLATAWCAKDRQETLTQLKSGVELPMNACGSAPIEEQYQLGVTLGVRGTPAIITSTGQMIPGYKSADELTTILGLN